MGGEIVTTPGISKVVAFSVLPEMAEQVGVMVKEGGRTMSELIRDAP